MNVYFLALIFILLVDGLKMIVEFFRVKPLEKKQDNYRDITVIMSAYNEEKMIQKTVQSFLDNGFFPEQILICDDGSTDNTSNAIREKFPSVQLFTESNRGKVKSLDWLLEKVTSKYVFICDADIVLDNNFYIPIWKLEEGKATGIAFNIVPYNKPKGFFKRLFVGLQSIEYAKSMLIGRQSQNKTMSVSCVSGASGIFLTSRMKQLAPLHSGNFSGEDLQRTLIELLNDGNVVFSNSVVYTDVPETFGKLSKQRIVGWWAGLYHCIPLSFRVFFFRKSPVILRYEILYDIVSMVTDPFKIYFFIMLLISHSWSYIGFLYLVYLGLEIISMLFIGNKYKTVLPKFFLVLSYPMYAFIQMIYRIIAFVRYFYLRFLTGEIKPLKRKIRIITTSLLLFISVHGISQSQSATGNIGVDTVKPKKKSPLSVAIEVNSYLYSNSLPNKENVTAYLGYKKLWWEGSFLADERQTIGYYIPKGLVWARWRTTDWQGYINRNLISSKGFISGINLTYQQIYRTDVSKNRLVELAGLEFEKYISDKSNFILSVRKEWGRRNDAIGILTYDYRGNSGFKMRLGAGVNSFGDKNAFAVITLDHLYFVGTYNERFDYNEYNRSSIGVGFKF